MCSVTSAIDHLSGVGLKFHCAGESPLVASATPCFVDSRYFNALSRSAADNDCAWAAITLQASTTRKTIPCFTIFRIPDFSCNTRILGPGSSSTFLADCLDKKMCDVLLTMQRFVPELVPQVGRN